MAKFSRGILTVFNKTQVRRRAEYGGKTAVYTHTVAGHFLFRQRLPCPDADFAPLQGITAGTITLPINFHHQLLCAAYFMAQRKRRLTCGHPIIEITTSV